MPAAITTLVNTWPQIVIYLLALIGVTWFLWRELKRVSKTIDDHDAKCSTRWEKNWDSHDTNGQRLSYIEGKLGIERQTDT